jgi:hypothetical protein
MMSKREAPKGFTSLLFWLLSTVWDCLVAGSIGFEEIDDNWFAILNSRISESAQTRDSL